MSDVPLTLAEREEKEKELEIIVRKALKEFRPILDRVADLMEAAGVDQQSAEILLLWMAGTSHGMRGEPVTSDLTLYTLARAWQYAATKTAN